MNGLPLFCVKISFFKCLPTYD